MKVLDEHDVAAVVVELRIENIAAVWGDRQSRKRTSTASLEYRACCSGGEFEVVECQDIVPRKEINAPWNNVPVCQEDSSGMPSTRDSVPVGLSDAVCSV